MASTKEYFMENPRTGFCLVFNHQKFKGIPGRVRHSKSSLSQISDTFHQLGFEVLVQNDYTKKQITSLLDNIASLDHSNEDCLAIVVLSARRHNGMLCAYDGEYPEESLWQPFSPENCPSLNKKPKLLFLQTFGQNGVLTFGDANFVSGSASSTVSQGPIPEDCLISWCKMDDYQACKRLGLDDVYVRYLCRELMSSTPAGFDLVTILSRVETSVMNGMLANPEFGGHLASQWPTYASTLNGLVIFLRKNEENLKRMEPIDKDLDNYTDSESECEDGDYSPKMKGRILEASVVKGLDGEDEKVEVTLREVEEEFGGGEGGEKGGGERGLGKSSAEVTEYSATFMQLMQRVLFLILYLADEGSDLYAAIKHVIYRRMVFAHLTFFFALMPHIHSIWIGMQKAKVAKIKFNFIDALTYHIRSLWQSLVFAYKSRHNYEKISLQEERGYNTHVRAWNGLDRSNAWDGDSKKIQRMYYEKMMTINLNLVPFEYLEVVNQAPFQIRSQLASLMIERRIPRLNDSPMIVSIFTSLVTLTSATHKDHYRVHFSKDWSNSLGMKARMLECTTILLIRSAHAVAMSTVAASQPLWIYCICQLPHSFLGLFLLFRSMSHPRYRFKKNPVKNALSLMGRNPSPMIFPWEYKTVENVLFLVDVMLLVISWKVVPTDDLHPLLNWYTPFCILSVHFIAICLSFLYRTVCHSTDCNPEIDVI